MLRLPLIWKLLLVPVFAMLSFATYLIYSSLVLSSSNAHLKEVHDILYPTLDMAEENSDSIEKIIDTLQTAAASGEIDTLSITNDTAVEVRNRYVKLQDIDTVHREEIKRLASEFDAYFSLALDIAQKMATRPVMPDAQAILKMRVARDSYITHLAEFRGAAKRRFDGAVKEATDNAKRARILGPLIGIIMLAALIGLTLVVTRGILVLEKQIVSISEETQQRLGQELHDDFGQLLTGIAFKSESLCQSLKNQDNPDFIEASKITTLVNEAVIKVRNLARSLYLEKREGASLPAMLGYLAESIESIYPIECSFVNDDEEKYWADDDPLVIINLFRIAQEAVNNSVKHSGATKITLRMKSTLAKTTLEIDDNGCGINKLPESMKGGLGMRIMQYRASLLGATLRIVALPSGGTRVSITIAAS